MRVLVNGALGYVGPLVVAQIRATHPEAEIVALDAGFFSAQHDAPGPSPDLLLDEVFYGDIRDTSPEDLDGFRHVEKPRGDGGLINGGFLVFEPEVLDLVTSGGSIIEEEVLPQLATKGQLMAFPHDGCWQPMDTLLDRRQLRERWSSGDAPWKSW